MAELLYIWSNSPNPEVSISIYTYRYGVWKTRRPQYSILMRFEKTLFMWMEIGLLG